MNEQVWAIDAARQIHREFDFFDDSDDQEFVTRDARTILREMEAGTTTQAALRLMEADLLTLCRLIIAHWQREPSILTSRWADVANAAATHIVRLTTRREAIANSFANLSLEIAARVWCDREMVGIAMDVEAATEIAKIIDRVREAASV